MFNVFRYGHDAINRSLGEYVGSKVHINNRENRASLLKPWLTIYRGMCREDLSLYLAAFKAYRRSRGYEARGGYRRRLKDGSYFVGFTSYPKRRPSSETSHPRKADNNIFKSN